jgi:peptidoglycan/xylan/chitin deacetylase (PgdA/CDA1 family)/glycosyltransferase involved in cell wall biosynthesis
MKILHVLSQTELTGAEVYATSLAEAQRKAGHEVIVISDKLHVPTSAQVLYQPISKRSWYQRRKNVSYIKKVVREYGIDVVHAHSRASSWVSFWATYGTDTAYVSTVHGRQHLHASLKYYDVYGDRVIAICQNVRDHLMDEVGINPEKLSVVPNGFDFTKAKSNEAPMKREIFLVGRTSGPKGERARYLIQNVFPRLMEKYSDLTISIAGGPLSNFDEKTILALNELKLKHGERICAREYIAREFVLQLMESSSLVICSGRLAIRALSLGKAVLAVGEAKGEGLIGPHNIKQAQASNFGDILGDKIEVMDFPFVESEIEKFLEAPAGVDSQLVEELRSYYSIDSVYRKVDSIYFEALLERRVPKRVPILMYHKVVEEGYESNHKTYITTEKFAGHLRALKNFGYESVTFEDLKRAALGHGKLPDWPVVLTFDDGYKGTYRRAIPLLKEHGFRAVFYVMSGDDENRKNEWDPIDEESDLISTEEMCALRDFGMEIGAHSLSHRKLSELADDELHMEVRESKRFLENLLGREVISFAYPFGNLCERSKASVKSHGYRFGVATDSGGLTLASDPFQIFRANIFPHDSSFSLRKKASRWYRAYYHFKRGK